MAGKYPHAFSPIKIGPVEVKNRIYIPPHGIHLFSSGGAHGSLVPSADFVHYLAERAAGGVGLIITPFTAFPRHRQMSAVYEESVPHWKAAAEAVHRHGTKIMAEIVSREGGISWEPIGAAQPSMGVSEYPHREHTTTVEMSVKLIRDWIGVHGRAARNLRSAGYDGVEVHVTHATLLMTFLSPYYNKRTDQYGGSFDNRMRALVETLEEVRRNVSDEMAVGMRLIADEMQPGGLEQRDTQQVIERLADLHLIDFVDMDVGEVGFYGMATGYPTPYQEPGGVVEYSAKISQGVAGKVVRMGIGGRITSIAQAEQILADGRLDMVGAVRGHIAEPNLVKNAMDGREDLSRTCLACNFCTGANGPRVGWGCVINPATGRERRWGNGSYVTSAHPSKVVIVGGGPAGMEAARVAARLGHTVVLFERQPGLGGALNLWASLPAQDMLVSSVDWYRRQMDEHGVQVRAGVEATASLVLAEQPDAVLVATGSRYERSGASSFLNRPIPGAERDFVYTPERILEGGDRPKGRVLVLDEDRMHTAVGIAELLATGGATVELVTRDFSVIPEVLRRTFEHGFVMPKLKRLGVKMTVGTYVKEVGDHTVTVYDVLAFDEEVRDVDAVVLATMRRSVSALAKQLAGRAAQVYLIGDAFAPRQFFEATYEAHRFARLIGVEGAPRTSEDALAPWNDLPADVQAQPAATLLETVLAR